VSALTGLNDGFKLVAITGKSSCLVWLLLTRLARGQRTALQTTLDHFWLFDDLGAHRLDARNTSGSHPIYGHDTWALTDSNGLVQEPCAAFQTGFRIIIQATSPSKSRTKTWTKYLRSEWFNMNPCSWQEVAFLACVLLTLANRVLCLITGPRRPMLIALWLRSVTSSMPVPLAPAYAWALHRKS
jgi:hypothetical protein